MLIGFYRYFRSDFLYPFIYSSTPVAQQKLNGEWNFWPRPQLFSYEGSQRMLIIICGGRLYIPDVWFLADILCFKKQVHILVFYFLLHTFWTVWLSGYVVKIWRLLFVYLISSHECNKYFKIILKNKCILYMLKMHSKIMYRVWEKRSWITRESETD